MIKVLSSNSFVPEKSYVLSVIFRDILKSEFEMVFSASQINYSFEISEHCKIVIEDHFFSKFVDGTGYLDVTNIPKNIKWLNVPFHPERIPIIFGTDKLEIGENEIVFGLDIIASIFFMLTRWEESVGKDRDEYGRFPAKACLAHREGFLQLPVVDLYVETLGHVIQYLMNSSFSVQNDVELVPTHDIDVLQRWVSPGQLLRQVAGDLFKRKDFSLGMERICLYYLTKRGAIKDCYDTFDYLMDKSESINSKSRFYFMSGGNNQFDGNYDIESKRSAEIISGILSRDHIVGFHPSFDAYKDRYLFFYEKEKLERAISIKVMEGRCHYLRFEVPTTWQIFEDAGMSVDSTCGYHDIPGFRCGTSREYFTYNILTRKPLKLKERPLIFMECTSFFYQNLSEKETMENFKALLERAREKFTFLWHNDSIKADFYARLFLEISKENSKVRKLIS